MRNTDHRHPHRRPRRQRRRQWALHSRLSRAELVAMVASALEEVVVLVVASVVAGKITIINHSSSNRTRIRINNTSHTASRTANSRANYMGSSSSSFNPKQERGRRGRIVVSNTRIANKLYIHSTEQLEFKTILFRSPTFLFLVRMACGSLFILCIHLSEPTNPTWYIYVLHSAKAFTYIAKKFRIILFSAMETSIFSSI